MISLNTTCPAGEGIVPEKATATKLLAPATGTPWRSTPTKLKPLLPVLSGTVSRKPVTLVQVMG